MTGRTVEEAVEAALDRLGVAETDAEVVVVEEPKSGMFGLRRSGARIRVRVRPVQPRAKRPSRRSSTGSGGGERGNRRQGGRKTARPGRPPTGLKATVPAPSPAELRGLGRTPLRLARPRARDPPRTALKARALDPSKRRAKSLTRVRTPGWIVIHEPVAASVRARAVVAAADDHREIAVTSQGIHRGRTTRVGHLRRGG